MKTVKVSREHHLFLKARGAERGLSLQTHLALILELSSSDNPSLKAARDEYFRKVAPLLPPIIKAIKAQQLGCNDGGE